MIVMVISLSSGIEITEIELNPDGTDSENEWIELYSKEDFNLENYYFENADEDTYELNGSFSGYFVIELDKQFLDNKEEIVYLKKESEEIDKSDEIKDEDNDNQTWSKCDEDWEFGDESKNDENECNEEESDDEEDLDKVDEIQKELEDLRNRREENKNNNEEIISNNFVSSKKIVLNSPSENDEVKEEIVGEENNFVSKKEKLRIWVVYVFLAFCVVLIVLLSLRKL